MQLTGLDMSQVIFHFYESFAVNLSVDLVNQCLCGGDVLSVRRVLLFDGIKAFGCLITVALHLLVGGLNGGKPLLLLGVLFVILRAFALQFASEGLVLLLQRFGINGTILVAVCLDIRDAPA